MPGLQTIIGPAALRHYREKSAPGISVAAVAIPVGLAYARITGVPTEIGLYASIVPTLAYALFGPSSRLPDRRPGLPPPACCWRQPSPRLA
jgi:hypothetical protein